MDDNKTRWVLETGRGADRELHGFATYADGLKTAHSGYTLGCSARDLFDDCDQWYGVEWFEVDGAGAHKMATLRQATDEDRAELARLEDEGEAA